MPKIKVLCEERYPNYEFVTITADEQEEFIEIPQEKLDWIIKVFEEYEEVQEYLIEIRRLKKG